MLDIPGLNIFGTGLFTQFHVVLSLVGIATGLIVIFGMLAGARMSVLTAIFLITTVLTSVTGFGFPFQQLLPSHIVGIISLVVLAIAIFARYVMHMEGHWRWVYVVGAVTAFYLNVFVLIVQLFGKVESLATLAPNQTEPPFVITHAAVLFLVALICFFAVRAFRPID